MKKMWGGVLLVSGTTVGAGMLANVIVTGLAGFYPSLILFFLYWVLMNFTALLFLEVNLWMTKDEGNMLTMAEMTLGKWGKVVCWTAYLFLLYALTTAYLAGGGPILNDLLEGLTGYRLPAQLESMPLLVIFGYFVYQGTHSIDYLNRWLMSALVISYGLMVIFLTPHVDLSLLEHVDMGALWLGSSVVATSFGFHIVIPSLTTYLDRDVSRLKKSILIGSAIPLVIYLIWQFLVLGIVPVDGSLSLRSGYVSGSNGAEILSAYLGNGMLSDIALIFFIL